MGKGVWIPEMLLSKQNIKFIYEIYKLMKKDEHFSVNSALRMVGKMLEDEKVVKFNDWYVISSFLPPFPSRALMTHTLAVNDREKIYSSQMLAKRSAPISFYVCVTNRCSYNCLHCSAKGRSEGEELSTYEWITVLKGIQNMNTPIIGFTGGDPLMREDIEELIASVDDRSVTMLFTSGDGLTYEKALALKRSGLFGVAVSLDSADAEKHNKMRRNKNAFNTAVNAIDNSRKAGLYTMLNTVITKKELSEDSLEKLFYLAEEHGVHEIRMLEPIMSGNLFNESDFKEIFYTKEDRDKLIDIQRRANKRKDFPKISAFANTESPRRYGCGAGTQHSYISASGNLYPCDFVPLSFGNVRTADISDLWTQMNNIIGNPKSECFAFKIHGKIKEMSNGNLPLEKDASIELCMKCRSADFPDFYKVMQGKN